MLCLGQEDPLEEGMPTFSSILAWRIPWTEEPGRLQSIGSQSQTRLERVNTHNSHVLGSFGNSVRIRVRAGCAQEVASEQHSPHTLAKNEQAVRDPRRG